MERNQPLAAAGTAVPVANSEAFSLTEPSQEPQHLQNQSSTFNSPTPHPVTLFQVPTISGLEYPNFPDESDGSTESSSDELSDLYEESEPEDLEDVGDPAEAIPRAMQMLEQISLELTRAEVDLGLQLLACKEPYHRLRSLMQHSHDARQSLDKIASESCVGREEYHQICERYRSQHDLQNEKHKTVVHPDPEIWKKHDQAATIARAFLGDPAPVLRDICNQFNH